MPATEVRKSSWTTLTGAAGIVVHDGRLLMIRQRRSYGVQWELPSGYHESRESLEEAAAREVLEETGIEVEVGDLVCTMVWERGDDRRRTMLAYFAATPVDPAQRARPQSEEGIEDAAFVDPRELAPSEIHPLDQAILDLWWESHRNGFHVHAEIEVNADGTQSYVIRSVEARAS